MCNGQSILPIVTREYHYDDENDPSLALTYAQQGLNMVADPNGDWVKVDKYRYQKLYKVDNLQSRVNDANLGDALKEMFDTVQRPAHYNQSGIECIDAIAAAVKGKNGIEAACVANVIKYLWRYELKNGVEDCRKAQWYLDRLVKELSK